MVLLHPPDAIGYIALGLAGLFAAWVAAYLARRFGRDLSMDRKAAVLYAELERLESSRQWALALEALVGQRGYLSALIPSLGDEDGEAATSVLRFLERLADVAELGPDESRMVKEVFGPSLTAWLDHLERFDLDPEDSEWSGILVKVRRLSKILERPRPRRRVALGRA